MQVVGVYSRVLQGSLDCAEAALLSESAATSLSHSAVPPLTLRFIGRPAENATSRETGGLARYDTEADLFTRDAQLSMGC
jgi:hypothetical protein